MNWLKGKKTHISATLLFIQALFSAVVGDMSWVELLSSPQLTQMLAAFGLSALRAGVSKNGSQ